MTLEAGSYAYTYLGGGAPGAIGETLCRDLPLGGHARLVPWAKVHGRQITSVEVLHDLPILALHGAHLTQVHAPLELTKCDADQYDVTRAWAHRLREWFPDIAGFQYRARHDEDSISWVLFDDRPPGPHARAGGSLRALPDSLPLDAGPGVHLLQKVLQAHNATLA